MEGDGAHTRTLFSDQHSIRPEYRERGDAFDIQQLVVPAARVTPARLTAAVAQGPPPPSHTHTHTHVFQLLVVVRNCKPGHFGVVGGERLRVAV